VRYLLFFFFLLYFTHLEAQNTSDSILAIDEVLIISKTPKQRGKEIMKEVIEKRSFYYEKLKDYNVQTYCLTTLDSETKKTDSIDKSTIMERTHHLEWFANSYVANHSKYKDYFLGYLDYSGQGKVELHGNPNSTTSPNVLGDESIAPNLALSSNAYVFVKGLKDADINLYANQIISPTITQTPIISPLAYNAFLFYSFYLEETMHEDEFHPTYVIRVEPIFKKEALFSGRIYVRADSWNIISYDLFVQPASMSFFKSFQIKCNYQTKGDVTYPRNRTFTYVIQEKSNLILGNSTLQFKDYDFSSTTFNAKFWNESIQYSEKAFDRDSSYWDSIRPIPLNEEEVSFLRKQDSIRLAHSTPEYLEKRDSIYNALSFWDITTSGMGFRNTFKKREIWISPLTGQIVPFGVGGYRHRIAVNYKKEFQSGKNINVEPLLDYGFTNSDLKGELALGFQYNPLNFSKVFLTFGDVYDFINSYQSLVGTFGPGNRVRNQKISVAFRRELVNGLFVKAEYLFSNRTSITGITYPSWVDAFGTFSKPIPFEEYTVSIFTLDFEYKHRQKFLIKDNQKIILGSKWPSLFITYKAGVPNLLNSQANFSFLEFRTSDSRKIKTFGEFNYRIVGGKFLQKKDLRIIEQKYFRTSDPNFFSTPTNSMQLLDTNLSTASSYYQANCIHHFNGFFLKKLWLINRLKLEESVGAGFLSIPEVNFYQLESFVGVERKVRISRYLWKFGLYAVNAYSSNNTSSFRLKFGINFYDSFRSKWLY
jgi:hypothetical protein